MKNSQVLFATFAAAVCLTSCQGDATSKCDAVPGNLQVGDHYLMCFMSSKGEWTGYAVSNDGVTYEALNDGDSIYSPVAMARLAGGTRDPYLCRRADNKGFLLATTDMKVQTSRVWNNYGIDLMTSADLKQWSSTTLDFREGPQIFSNPDAPSVYNDWRSVSRVWAPQTFWDAEKHLYMVYFSMLNLPEESYDRVYYCYADSAFTRLTQPQLLFDWGYATTDADIHYNPATECYQMLVKREGEKPGIVVSEAPSLTGPWSKPGDEDIITLDTSTHTEGVSAYPCEEGWRIGYVEHETGSNHYLMGIADKTMHNIRDVHEIPGVTGVMQASYIRITKEELARIKATN